MDDTPWIAVGADELGEPVGATVACTGCGTAHPVEHGTDAATGRPSTVLAFYRCGGAVYLAGVGGRAIRPRSG